MPSNQVTVSMPAGTHKRLTAYRDALAVEIERRVTFGEAIDELMKQIGRAHV